MRKMLLTLLAAFTINFVFAQIANTKWNSTINIDGPVNTIFDFKKDTVSLYTVADSIVIETMTYTSDDTSITVIKIQGESDCDNNMPGRYSFTIKNEMLNLKMITDDCEDRSSVIEATSWKRWKEHHDVKVAEAILKQYAGVYQLDDAHPVTVSLENGKLYAEARNNKLPKSPLIAVSNTKFFLRIAGVEWDFVKDANGKVIKLISHEEKDYELKKVK